MPSPCTPSLGSSNKRLGWVAEGSVRTPTHDNLPAAPKPQVQRDALELCTAPQLRAAGLWAGAGVPQPRCWGAVMEGEPPHTPNVSLAEGQHAATGLELLGSCWWGTAPQTLLGAAAWSHVGYGVPHLGTAPAQRHGNRHRERAAPCARPCCAPSQAVPAAPPRESHGWSQRRWTREHRPSPAARGNTRQPRCRARPLAKPCREVPAGCGGLLLAEDEALVVGRHVHLQAQSWGRGGGHRHGDRPPGVSAPTILSRRIPLASASCRSSAVSRRPQAGLLPGREAAVRQTDGQADTSPPE